MSNTFSTPIPAVLSWEWNEILEWYCEAFNMEVSKASFQARIAGMRFVG